MNKTIIVLILNLALISICSLAYASHSEKYFNKKSACFILFDLNTHQLISEYNPQRCREQIAPDSTFKIPLSLMAFDQRLIKQDTIFKWDKQNRSFIFWNQDQTPQTWLKNSVVWVSQLLTPQLGMNKIKYYLKQFNYGNQDFSGDAGMNNGLSKAWLSSSLKISGDEQLSFIKNLILNKLPISQEAMDATKSNLYLETSASGWKLYGKTGTGTHSDQTRRDRSALEDAWFVGYTQKADQVYIFVINFTDFKKNNNKETGGARAKKIAMTLLEKQGAF